MVVDGALQVTDSGRARGICAHSKGGIGIDDDLGWCKVGSWCGGGGGEGCCWLRGEGVCNCCVAAWMWTEGEGEGLWCPRTAQEHPRLKHLEQSVRCEGQAGQEVVDWSRIVAWKPSRDLVVVVQSCNRSEILVAAWDVRLQGGKTVSQSGA